jgi:aminoglycoside phosphotransferase (APT) family kinase protein
VIGARPDALARWLADRAGAEGAEIVSAARLSGGAIQENWAVEAEFRGGPAAGRHALVIRTDAPTGVALSHGRAREFALLRAAFGAGVAVPEPLWCCEDAAVLGRPFFAMRRVEGVAAGHRLVRDDALVPDRAGLVRSLGRELARIHSIRPPREDLGFLPPPEEASSPALVRGFRAWLDNQGTPRPALEWGLRWLERNAPPRGAAVLCHNDFRTGNYMVAAGRATGVLDWEFAGWGDPLADIGWFCAPCWRFGARGAVAGGIGGLDDFLAGYGEGGGAPVERASIPYWIAMATMRWAVIALQQAARHARGGEDSLELALTGQLLPELELDILEMTASR